MEHGDGTNISNDHVSRDQVWTPVGVEIPDRKRVPVTSRGLRFERQAVSVVETERPLQAYAYRWAALEHHEVIAAITIHVGHLQQVCRVVEGCRWAEPLVRLL